MEHFMLGKHSSSQFNEEMESIHRHLMEMGGLVKSQVEDSLHSLLERDEGRAQQVMVAEHRVDTLEKTIDERCAHVLALRQPAATDLRMLIAVSKCVSDLERIGDEAAKIAGMAIQLSQAGVNPRDYREIPLVGEHVIRMLDTALDAFARFDANLAVKVAVDLDYRDAMRSFSDREMENQHPIANMLNLIWTLRALERVGDHSRNICEQIIYLVKGKDVRHISADQIEREVNSN